MFCDKKFDFRDKSEISVDGDGPRCENLVVTIISSTALNGLMFVSTIPKPAEANKMLKHLNWINACQNHLQK